jgi:tRNA nucleotidyltransferase (CCA-adding enzyme)
MRFPAHIQVYAVGGAVRDQLLGLPVKDRDYVVVGATPAEMESLGFRAVGKDFPVFLHPRTQAEYALARTERKSGPGYKGFQVHSAPDVSLEDDLRRRDLTINAMAMGEDGRIIDPYGGRDDLNARRFRHVSPAFDEDPVRLLRVARFAARFPDFSIAPETLERMRALVSGGEIDALVPERVWQELARGLMEAVPSRMLRVLRECGALARLLPEIDRLFGIPQRPEVHPEIDCGAHVLRVIDGATLADQPLAPRFAALTHDLGKGMTPRQEWPSHTGHEMAGQPPLRALCARLRVPADCRDLALLAVRWHGQAHRALALHAGDLLDLLTQTDALRRPERFAQFLTVCAADFRGRPGFEAHAYAQADRLRQALHLASSVDAGAISRQAQGDIAAAIRQARLEALDVLEP